MKHSCQTELSSRTTLRAQAVDPLLPWETQPSKVTQQLRDQQASDVS